MAACAKHFVGDGGTVNGINENNTVINREGLMNIHMPAYMNAMRQGVSTVMISYSSWNGVKMHANQDLVTGYLKETLKFQVKKKDISFLFRCSTLVAFLYSLQMLAASDASVFYRAS